MAKTTTRELSHLEYLKKEIRINRNGFEMFGKAFEETNNSEYLIRFFECQKEIDYHERLLYHHLLCNIVSMDEETTIQEIRRYIFENWTV